MNWRDLDIPDQTAKNQEQWELNQRLYRAWKSGLPLERVSEILGVSLTAACAVLIFDAERSRHKPPVLDYINFDKNREWQKCAIFEKALKTITFVNSDREAETNVKTKRAAEFPINLSDWNFPELNDIRKILQKQVENAVRWALDHEDGGPDAYLPIIFGPKSDGLHGKTPEDPLTVYIRIPLCGAFEEAPSWSFSFGELVKSVIDDYTDELEYKESEDEKRDLCKLREALLHLADLVGNAIDRC